jgi:hypothetical protein
MAVCYTKFTKPLWEPGYWLVAYSVFLGVQDVSIRYTHTLLASYRTKKARLNTPYLFCWYKNEKFLSSSLTHNVVLQ